jgi:hypothetical protein
MKETLEQAAEKEFPLLDTQWCKTGAAEDWSTVSQCNHEVLHKHNELNLENLELLGHRKSFIKGAKWQAERMYSEEEVNLMFATLKANSVDNIATITNVDLFISSWKDSFKPR